MKIGVKLLAAALLSLSVGIACASPLLVSELDIKPWVQPIPGPKAEFNIEVVFANFTVLNGSKQVTYDDGPTVSYFAVLNITNLSDIGAKLFYTEFIACQKIVTVSTFEFPSAGNASVGGGGYFASGAWVDGVWYNVTYVVGGSPMLSKDGKPMDNGAIPGFKPYWMEGVQLMDAYVDGKFNATYMNMNGTWADVTGRINVTRPEQTGTSYRGFVVMDHRGFAHPMPSNYTLVNGTEITNNRATTIVNGNLTSNGSSIFTGNFSSVNTTPHEGLGFSNIYVGEGLFDNYWQPHESRLIALLGIRNFIGFQSAAEGLAAVKSGNLTLQATAFNVANDTVRYENGTLLDTIYEATESKRVQITQFGDSYIYNSILGENEKFLPDQWGVEVFIKPVT